MENVRNILQIADYFRQHLLAREQEAIDEILGYYQEIEGQIAQQLEILIRKMEQWQHEHPGEEGPPIGWLFEEGRLQLLQQQVRDEFATFAAQADQRIQAGQQQLIGLAEDEAEALVQAELPPGIAIAWTQLPTDVLGQLVGMLQDGSPLRDLLDALGQEASKQIREELVRGIALGLNPQVVARRCVEALHGNRARAETIARTEMLRAYREATRQSYLANSDVVAGWIWHATRDERTCPMCWAMHGTFHTLDEHLDDHPRGRCAMVPQTKTWEELGFEGVPEMQLEIEPGESLFAQLPEEQQRAILGNAGYEAYKAGVVRLRDFVGQKIDPRWGTMRYTRSLKEILSR